MEIDVTTTYLEMTSPEHFRPKFMVGDNVVVRKVGLPTPAINHFFFTNVGRPWRWYSRLEWNAEDWQKQVTRAGVSTWIGYIQDTPFGYFELEQKGDHTEIVFLGLLPQFIGKGLGGGFVSEAINVSWWAKPDRVWLHTCSLDHPAALKNYLARGFVIYKEETKTEKIPDDGDPAWHTPEYYQSLGQQKD